MAKNVLQDSILVSFSSIVHSVTPTTQCTSLTGYRAHHIPLGYGSDTATVVNVEEEIAAQRKSAASSLCQNQSLDLVLSVRYGTFVTKDSLTVSL
jgi:hypothetical protein